MHYIYFSRNRYIYVNTSRFSVEIYDGSVVLSLSSCLFIVLNLLRIYETICFYWSECQMPCSIRQHISHLLKGRRQDLFRSVQLGWVKRLSFFFLQFEFEIDLSDQIGMRIMYKNYGVFAFINFGATNVLKEIFFFQ